MIKIIGIAMVVAAGIGFGSISPLCLRHRLVVMEQMLSDLTRMRHELNSEHLSVPELMELMLSFAGNETLALYRNVHHAMHLNGVACFTDVWQRSVEAELVALQSTEREAIGALGEILGQYLLEDQLTAIDTVCGKLRESISSLKTIAENKMRVSLSFAVAVSLMVAVLLL